MRNGKHVAKRTGSKVAVVAIALALVCCMAVGGTLAWLMDSTNTVTNTFTTSDVDIELTETNPTGNSAQMIPGYTIEKDPTITVKKDSEMCYLFVKIEKQNGFENFMEYTIADGWTELTEGSGVFYRTVEKNPTKDLTFAVLKDNKVTVKSEVTKAMMDGVTADKYPTLSFTAYAIQYYETNNTEMSVTEAWAAISTPNP